MLSNEAGGQSDFGGPFEPFDCNYFFGVPVLGFVDFSIGAFCNELKECEFVGQFSPFHHNLMLHTIIICLL